MKATTPGRTGLDVSVIGAGLEHMRGQPREMVVSTLRAAVERGVNYFDVIFNIPGQQAIAPKVNGKLFGRVGFLLEE